MPVPSIPTVSALKHLMKRRSPYMPNVDFDRSIVNNRMPQTLNSPDLKHRLLSVKAYLDYEDEHIVRVNFLDTLLPGRQHTISIETPTDDEDEVINRRGRCIAPTADVSAPELSDTIKTPV